MGCPLLARQTAQNLVLESWNLKRCILSVAGGVYLKEKEKGDKYIYEEKGAYVIFIINYHYYLGLFGHQPIN